VLNGSDGVGDLLTGLATQGGSVLKALQAQLSEHPNPESSD